MSISEVSADPRPTPEQALERSELRALVTKVACGLPAAQRAALRFRQGDGLSIREAARRLGVPEGTLKAQLARGRTALTRRFQKADGKCRTKAAIPDAKAKRTDGCAGNGPDSARWKYPSRLLVSKRNKEDTKPGLAHSGHFLNDTSPLVLQFKGSRRGGSPVPLTF